MRCVLYCIVVLCCVVLLLLDFALERGLLLWSDMIFQKNPNDGVEDGEEYVPKKGGYAFNLYEILKKIWKSQVRTVRFLKSESAKLHYYYRKTDLDFIFLR